MPTLITPQRDLLIDMIQPVDLMNPLGQGLVAAYPMFPGTTGGPRLMDVVDPGPNGNHGTLVGMDKNAWVPSGDDRVGYALEFDGTDDRVSASTSLNSDGCTIIVAGKFNSATDTAGHMLDISNGSTARIVARSGSNDWFIRDASSNTINSVALGISDGIYSSFALTINIVGGEATATPYVDGVAGTPRTSGDYTDTALNACDIGASPFGGNTYGGTIDNVLLYGRVLFPAEIKRVHLDKLAPFRTRQIIPYAAAAAAVGNPWYYYAQQGAA